MQWTWVETQMLHWLRGVLLENGWSCVWLRINCAAVTLVTAYKVWNTLKDISLYVLWVRRKKWKRLNSLGTPATAKCWPWNMEVGAFILKLDMGDEWHLWMALYIYIFKFVYATIDWLHRNACKRLGFKVNVF